MLRLSQDEIDILIKLSAYYGRVLSSIRRLIEVCSTGEMREKARFVREESYWLRQFTKSSRDSTKERADCAEVKCTARTLVALYGRLLANLNVPRTRRRLSGQQIEAREVLGEKMLRALVALQTKDNELVRREIATRRPRENAWITEKLEGATSERAMQLARTNVLD